MGESRTSHSGGGLTERQEQFSRLIAQGMSYSEACRVVGINRRTGTRWRYGRTVRNTAGEAAGGDDQAGSAATISHGSLTDGPQLRVTG